MTTKYKKEAKFYHQHGIRIHDYDAEESEVIADCPFCGKLRHFYFDQITSCYGCKVCDEEGNASTFMRKIVSLGLEITEDDDYWELADKKQLPEITVLKKHKVCLSPFRPSLWLIPMSNFTEGFSNLYVYNPETNDLFGSAERPQCLYRSEQSTEIKKSPKTDLSQIIIAEGHWDTLLAAAMFREAIDEGLVEVVGVPGATTFKEAWVKYLAYKDVVMLHDNDDAGEKGIQRIIKLVEKHNTPTGELMRLDWDESFPPGFDLKDLWERNEAYYGKRTKTKRSPRKRSRTVKSSNRSAGKRNKPKTSRHVRRKT